AFDPADVITVQSYDALATGTIARDFPGAARLINPASDPYSGFVWDPLFMEGSRDLMPLPAPPDSARVPGSAVFRVSVAELTAACRRPPRSRRCGSSCRCVELQFLNNLFTNNRATRSAPGRSSTGGCAS